MPPEHSKFRLGESTLADLDSMARSAGNRSAALREAVAYWRHLLAEAAAINAEKFSSEDWTRLAHLNRIDAGDEPCPMDLGKRLAIELVGMWEGRVVLPLHQAEADACKALAKRVARVGMVRGFALYSALRWFWGGAGLETAAAEWWQPENWM